MNPRIAQTIYALGTLVTTIVGIALLWGGIDAGTADSIGQIVGGIGVLIGGTPVTATAAVRTTKQINNGTLGSPADQIVNGITAIAATKAQAEADIAKVTQTAQAVLGVIPGGPDLMNEILAAGRALGAPVPPLPTPAVTT